MTLLAIGPVNCASIPCSSIISIYFPNNGSKGVSHLQNRCKVSEWLSTVNDNCTESVEK
ncbi:hypothetical protein D3C72_2081340 [compost metagenome]